jgi:DNA helicase II / ATP-dependent DNA helicase PcrA
MADKRLILAVAGSGKTKYLIDHLNLDKRFLIVTYTNTSLDLIKSRIIKKFGYLPTNIKTHTYFEFIYGFCIKPFVLFKYNLKGIYWEPSPEFTTYLSNTNSNKYLTKNRYLYHNRLGKFIEFENIIEDIKKRLEKFYDHFFYDEFQDLGGHDFNFITSIAQANINFLFVGDFFQHTYVTSYDGNVNGTLYSDLNEYCSKLKANNIQIDIKTLGNSFRCSPTICSFISKNLLISIDSKRKDETSIIKIEDRETALKIIENNSIIKLVYDKSNERNYYAKNWGECKGEDDYNDTCIILNKTTAKIFSKEKFNELKPRTKNKLYVALTRTRENCYLIEDELIR